jgi:hypothetical protein
MLGAALLILDETPNYLKMPAGLGTQVGWLCFGVLLCALFWAWTRAESVRRSLLALEDPRMLAVMRIGFALMTIQCFWNLKPYWRMLWSDEGIYLLEEARQRLGRSALSGWTPEDGFFDLWAVARFFWGKYSFFFLEASPAFVNAYMYAFFGVLLLFAAGVASRITGLISFVMMTSVYNHNALYMEGTDTVYRVFWFILLFGKTGHAWSVDNWLRCWWLRRRGALASPEDPAAPGKAPIYRLVPAWPRYLMMAQLVGIYTETGLVKTGRIWARGDALYYSLNMDHFYRFEGFTQQVSAIFGTNVFKVMTYVTHWWEMCFAAAGLGMILKFGLDHRDQAWYRAAYASAWRRWSGRAALLAAYVAIYRINVLAYPYSIDTGKNAEQAAIDQRLAEGLAAIDAAYLLWIPLAIALWFIAGRWPRTVIRPGRRLGPLPIPAWSIDQVWLHKWFLGRRTWLGLGFCFHGFLILFMNIGMFPFIMLMSYAAWIRGEEYAAALAWLFKRLRARRWTRWLAPQRADALAQQPQPADHVPLRGRRIPDLLVLALGLVGVALVYARATGELPEPKPYARAWFALMLVVALIYRFVGRRPAAPGLHEGGPALAYGTIGRYLALALTVWHGASVLMILFPSYPVFNPWRGAARGIFTDWTAVTGTSQSWKMFAPNPPTGNGFMKTVVVEPDGDRWDLRNNSYENRPNPWIWNDRMRKMHRRMTGKGKWYLRYWANYHCRDWYLERGVWPDKIEVFKIVTKIPSPEQVRAKGWYQPSKLKATTSPVETLRCPSEGVPLYIKERYGLPITEEDRRRAATEAEQQARSYKGRRDAWDRRRDFGGDAPAEPTAVELALRRVKRAQGQQPQPTRLPLGYDPSGPRPPPPSALGAPPAASPEERGDDE